MLKRIGILSFLAIILLGFYYFNKTLPGKLFISGVKMNSSGFKLTDSYSQKVGTNDIRWTEAENGSVKLIIGKAKPESKEKYISDRILSLESLFEPNTSPYPEVITNTIVCGQEFKPVESDTGTGKIFKLYAGERFDYGICAGDLIKYDSIYGIFDCGQKGVFEIKLFDSPGKGTIENLIKSFNCK